MWPIDEINDTLKMYNAKKREVFTKYMEFADHHVEWAEIPYRGKTLPAVFHLPPGYRSGSRIPVVVIVPGMDGYKEKYVSLYADAWMQRGVGALCVEGPGYWEAPLRSEGRKRAMTDGVKFGRKPKLSEYQRAEAVKRRAAGETLASIAKSYGVDLSMISRLA